MATPNAYTANHYIRRHETEFSGKKAIWWIAKLVEVVFKSKIIEDRRGLAICFVSMFHTYFCKDLLSVNTLSMHFCALCMK